MAWVKFIFNRPNLADIMKARGLSVDGAVVYKYHNTIYTWPSDKSTGVLRKGDPLLCVRYPVVDADQIGDFYEATADEIKFDFEDFMEAINLNKTNHYRPMWNDLTEVERLLNDVKNLVIWTIPDRTILYSFIHHIIYSRLTNYISNIIQETTHYNMREYNSRVVMQTIPIDINTDHITIACDLLSMVADRLMKSSSTYHNVIIRRDDERALTRDSYKNLSYAYDFTGNDTWSPTISEIDSWYWGNITFLKCLHETDGFTLVKVIYDAVDVIDDYRRHRMFYNITNGKLPSDVKFEGGLTNHDDSLNLIVYDETETQSFVDKELTEIGKRYGVKPPMIRTLLLYYMLVNREKFKVYSNPTNLYTELIRALTVSDESDDNPDYEFNGRMTYSTAMDYAD